MADYYPLISRAVAALETNTSQTRRALYDRARAAQWDQLRNRPEDFGRERVTLEDAIIRVERIGNAADHAPSDAEVISDYGKFCADSKDRLDCFYDASLLPHPKEAIVAAIERQIVLTAPDALAKYLAEGPTWLWNFVDGVGSLPAPHISPELLKPSPDNATPAELTERAERIRADDERFERFKAIAERETKQIEQRVNAALWIRKERLDYDRDFDCERPALEGAIDPVANEVNKKWKLAASRLASAIGTDNVSSAPSVSFRGVFMVDYYPLMSRAVAALKPNTPESRRALYDRARAVKLDELKTRPYIKKDFDRERLMLETAISRVEADVQSSTRSSNLAIQKRMTPQSKVPTEQRGGSATGMKKETTREKLAPIMAAAGAGLLVVLGVSLFALFIYVAGNEQLIIWLSSRGAEYLDWPVGIAFILCIVLFPPLLLFRKTRGASAIGFLISSYIFGASTWLAGILNCYMYFGGFWVFVGLCFFGIGVVPMAIIGAMIHSDWVIAGSLLVSLALTFGVRWIGLGIGAWAVGSSRG